MFGPPQRFTIASTCSWLGHSVSGLRHDTSHPLQIRFRFGFASLTLNLASHRNSPARSTKSTIPHSYGAVSACKLTVSGSISLPSRGSFHLSLTVLFAIGHMVVFSLLGWSPFLPSGFLVSRRTPDTASLLKVSSTGVSPSLRIPRVRRYSGSCRLASCFTYEALTLSCRASHPVRLQYAITYAVLNPGCISTSGLASSAFARHYSQNLV